MKSEPPKPSSVAERASDRAKAEKAARLAQALRDNLRRRKAGKSPPASFSPDVSDKDGD